MEQYWPPYLNAVRLSFSQYVPRYKINLVAVEARKYGLFSLYLQLSRVTRKTRKIFNISLTVLTLG